MKRLVVGTAIDLDGRTLTTPFNLIDGVIPLNLLVREALFTNPLGLPFKGLYLQELDL